MRGNDDGKLPQEAIHYIVVDYMLNSLNKSIFKGNIFNCRLLAYRRLENFYP